ncbi:LysR family transcriptional regulator [Mesorhizobium qingshengii]|uniref:LysR family transcriptional regulator n=1 Tax=Mesorhizobium qingshengii TaxID=1165689 RepID=A0ABT4R095_9HYPH|nr:LysR family transcriptional regulator [Mesorhizobium qingshengii]MCZ8547245.1 LysR family transcriptional regulator [Mesorhizobium qingshengii]
MLEELRTLVLFAEEGSIQNVARRLPLTQPAVTRQMQRLEDMLGTTLLDRRQKPPRLTGAGLEVLARAKDILASVEALKAFAAEAEPQGVLRVGLAHGLSDASVAGAIAGAAGAFPRISLRLKTGWSAELIEQFERGQLDMAIVLRPADHQRSDALGTERLCIIAQAGGTEPHLTDARTPMPWVLSPEPCDARQRLLSSLGGERHRLVVAAEIQDPAMQMEWVRRGHGLGLMPLRLAARGLPDGLALVDLEDVDLSLQVVALRAPHLNRLAKAVEAIAEAVGEAMKMEA